MRRRPPMVKSSLVEIRVFELVRRQGVVVDLGIVIEMLLEGRDAFLQPVDLVDGALERETEGIHGAFQALEEVDLHHGDEDSFAAFLGEAAEDLVFDRRRGRSREVVAQEAGGMIEGQAAGR